MGERELCEWTTAAGKSQFYYVTEWMILGLFSTARRLVRARSHVEDEPSFRFTLLIAFAVPLNIFHVQ